MSQRLVTLGEVADINPRPNWKAVDQQQVVSFVPMAAVSDVEYRVIDQQERPLADVRKGFTYFQRGDILLAKITPCFENGKVAVADIEHEHGFGSTEFHVIRAKEDVVHPRLLYYLMRRPAFLAEGAKNMTGSAGQKRLPKSYLDALAFTLPPWDAQLQLVDAFDKADALRRKDQEMLRKYDELVQSIFYELFGDPARNEMGWNMVTIRDLVHEVKYGTSSPASAQGAFPYLRMNNITYNGELDLRDLKRIDVSERDYVKYGVRPGDLLFNRTNSKELVGKTAVVDVDQPMVAAGYLIRVRCNEHANPYFISAYLNSEVGKGILRNMCKNIIGMANINAQELQDIPIIAPPKELQDAFESKILAIKRMKELAIKNTEYSEALFASQLQRYF